MYFTPLTNMLFLLLVLLIAVLHSRALKDPRDEEFSRIKHYDLIYFNEANIIEIEESTTNIFEFDLNDQHYKIKLTRNDDHHVVNIRHPSINNKLDQHFTNKTLKQSCHYYGRVLNAEDPSLTAVSLSFCDNRGVRGRIVAFNETIEIVPSAYFLDKEKDSKCNHELSDQHLIYKLSDFDFEGMGKFGSIKADTEKQIKQKIENDINDKKRRRLYNNGLSNTEMFIVNGPIRTKYYQSEYTNWYSQMISDYTDLVQKVSNEYMLGQWGNTVGEILVKFVEIEVIFDFTGRYVSLAPDFLKTTCQYSYDDCQINGRGWLSIFNTWVSQYKDVSTFDVAHIISNMQFTTGYAGWGNIGVVCKGSSSVSDIYVGWGLNYVTRTMAHELGHNFGMWHDGQTGEGSSCDSDAGLMGYGSGQGFSYCSIASLQNYFSSNNGLTCLGSGYSSGKWTTNYNSGVAPNPTPRPTVYVQPTPQPTSPSSSGDDWDCVGINNLYTSQYNGYWSKKGNYQGYPYYEKSGAYLYYGAPNYNFYLMSTTVGSTSVFGYCPKSDVSSCGGAFKMAVNGAWQDQTASNVYDCGSNDDTSSSCSSYECVGISGMASDKYGTSYNGQWKPAGCHNGQSYYQNTAVSSRYLCYSSDYSLWIISNQVCGSAAFAYCPTSTTAILNTANNWNIATNSGWGYDSQVFVVNCGGNGGFLDEDTDLTCLDDNEYNDKLCITRSNDTSLDDYYDDINSTDSQSLWSGNRTFEIYEKQCQNNKPVYHYTESNIIDGDDAFGNSGSENIDTIYYLHYHKQLLYSDSNQTFGQWIISKDEISINSVATCEQEDLLNCKANSWLVEAVEFSEPDGNNTIDTLLLKILDDIMEINNEQCANDVEAIESDDGNKNVTVLVIVILLVLAVIMFIIGVLIWRRMNKKETQKIKATLGSTRETQRVQLQDEEDEEEEELSPKNPELEVSIEKEDGPVITATYN